MSDATRALAASLRFQAMALRSQAELLSSQADVMEMRALGVEHGADFPRAAMRLEVVEDEQTGSEERRDGLVEAMQLEREPLGFPGMPERVMWATLEGEALSEDMLDWLTLFDARVTSPCDGRPFIDAVNIAAAEGMALNDKTAAWVAEKAAELRSREEQG